MIRPRHRQKSSLLWKMLGVAGVINVAVWPALIREGVFAGIHQETLIPVTLIRVPPAHKPPDALQIVARVHAAPPHAPAVPLTHPAQTPPTHTAMSVRPNPAKRVVAAALTPKAKNPLPDPSGRFQRPFSDPMTGLETGSRALLTAQEAPARLPPAYSVRQTPLPDRPKSQAKPRPLVASQPAPPPQQAIHHAASRPVRVAQAESAPLAARSLRVRTMPRDPHTALAARIARAKRLEAEGHRVAEWIAQQRTEGEAAPPTPSVPTAPVVVAEELPVPHATEEAVIPVLPAKRPPVVPHDVAAVAVRKAHPQVPDAMMYSAWHATFRGEFVVHRDGAATVRMVSSTGFAVLDRRALAAARRWKFQPARRNGVAIASVQPFAFEYDVHPIR